MLKNWIKMRSDLSEDPKVLMIATMLDVDPFDVCGRLLKIWAVADKYSDEEKDGLMKGSPRMVDRLVRIDGFSTAMESVGWIVFHENEMMSFPSYAEHNGTTAKSRAQSQVRVANKRKRDADVTDMLRHDRNTTVTRIELELEEKKKNNKNPPLPPQEEKAFEEFWAAYPKKAGKGAARKAYQKAVKREGDNDAARSLILDACKTFSRSDTGRAGRFCPHAATWLNQERYADDPLEWNRGREEECNEDPLSRLMEENKK